MFVLSLIRFCSHRHGIHVKSGSSSPPLASPEIQSRDRLVPSPDLFSSPQNTAEDVPEKGQGPKPPVFYVVKSESKPRGGVV